MYVSGHYPPYEPKLRVTREGSGYNEWETEVKKFEDN